MLYTLSFCHDQHVAEDIVSTAFFRALQTADGAVEDFKAWLLTVCRNEYFTYCRRKKRQIEATYEPSGGEDPAERVIKDEAYRALYRAITLLIPEQREAVLLFYFSGMSVRQIAAITGKSEGNVKVLLHRARQKLKAILEEK